MSQQPIQLPLPGFEAARVRWQDAYGQQIGADNTRRNRSGFPDAKIFGRIQGCHLNGNNRIKTLVYGIPSAITCTACGSILSGKNGAESSMNACRRVHARKPYALPRTIISAAIIIESAIDDISVMPIRAIINPGV